MQPLRIQACAVLLVGFRVSSGQQRLLSEVTAWILKDVPDGCFAGTRCDASELIVLIPENLKRVK
jgi:hypothetical protein